jgi:hypothetical protein
LMPPKLLPTMSVRLSSALAARIAATILVIAPAAGVGP